MDNAVTSNEFDQWCEEYDTAMQMGLGLTGETREYFARCRMQWLHGRLRARRLKIETALDFGCGVGSGTPWFFETLGIRQLIGTDVSQQSLQMARNQWSEKYDVRFGRSGTERPSSVDLAFCNGVFHHIDPDHQERAIRQVHRAVKSNGLFAFFENNPANPGTRWAMSRVPFDANAMMLWPGQARRLLQRNGFRILCTDYVFWFPRFVAALRPLEPWLCKLPLGGQYMILARKERQSTRHQSTLPLRRPEPVRPLRRAG